MVDSFYLSFSLNMNPLLLAIAITGCQSPSEVKQKGCSSNQPLKGPQGAPGGPKVPIITGFDAKIMNIADLDYSASVNSGMRPVLCFFPYILVHIKRIRKGAHQTNLSWVPKYLEALCGKDFDAKMVNIADFD